MIHEVCVYFLAMFSFSNLKVIQKSLFIIFSERKNCTIHFEYDKKRNSCEKTERRKRKTNKQSQDLFHVV